MPTSLVVDSLVYLRLHYFKTINWIHQNAAADIPSRVYRKNDRIDGEKDRSSPGEFETLRAHAFQELGSSSNLTSLLPSIFPSILSSILPSTSGKQL